MFRPRGARRAVLFFSSLFIRLFAPIIAIARNISSSFYHLDAWPITYPYRSVIDDKF